MSRLTLRHLKKSSAQDPPLTAITAYDASFARIADQAGIDLILVGDSMGNTILGFDSTVPVTLAMMQHHGAAVVRGSQRCIVGVDLPFGSYHEDSKSVVDCIRKLFQKTGCQFLKLEGAGPVQLKLIRTLSSMGIPVMGHLGYTPQQSTKTGGPRAAGNNAKEARELKKQALALQAAGAIAIVFEMLPATLAARLTKQLKIPTIGIGSGPQCDGQILVLHDVLGLDERFLPRFAKRYARIEKASQNAIASYAADVRQRSFPPA